MFERSLLSVAMQRLAAGHAAETTIYAAMPLSRDIAREIEKELEYPGQITVTVIREWRSVEYAK